MTQEQFKQIKDAARTIAEANDHIEQKTRRMYAVMHATEVTFNGGESVVVVNDEDQLHVATVAVAREIEADRSREIKDLAEYILEFAMEVESWLNKG
jgi:hypothetical protein